MRNGPVSFKRYCRPKGRDFSDREVRIETVPKPMRPMFERRNEHLRAGRELCSNCQGKGNLGVYTRNRCEECGGSGSTG